MTDQERMLEKVRALGMNHNWAISFVKQFLEDEKEFSDVPEEKKRWAMEKGFFPGRVPLYGLNEENWQDYLPDWHYAMMHPYNNHFLKWLDKTTLKYVLNSSGCEDTMPDYYAYVENDGSYTYLMNCPEDIPKNRDFLMNLLNRFGTLAMKPNSGTAGGLGFIKLEKRGGTVCAPRAAGNSKSEPYAEELFGEGLWENNHPISMERFEEIRDSMRNYIITAYAHQHPVLAAIWPESECTLRVILCKNPKKDLYAEPTWTCVGSFARFGTSAGGGASNLTSGGIGIGFDYDTGELYDTAVQYRRFARDGRWLLKEHPDTGVVWKGVKLPHWDFVRAKIDQLCRHISSLDYLGLDIIITEDGMKLCEINSLPALGVVNVMCGPVMRRKEVREFFVHKGMNRFDGRDFYRAYLESQAEDK